MFLSIIVCQVLKVAVLGFIAHVPLTLRGPHLQNMRITSYIYIHFIQQMINMLFRVSTTYFIGK